MHDDIRVLFKRQLYLLTSFDLVVTADWCICCWLLFGWVSIWWPVASCCGVLPLAKHLLELWLLLLLRSSWTVRLLNVDCEEESSCCCCSALFVGSANETVSGDYNQIMNVAAGIFTTIIVNNRIIHLCSAWMDWVRVYKLCDQGGVDSGIGIWVGSLTTWTILQILVNL